MTKPPIILKNSLKAYFARLGVMRFIVALLIIGVYTYARPMYGVVIFVCVAVVLGLVFWHIAHRKTIVSDDAITSMGGLARKKVIRRSNLQGVLLAHYVEPGFGVTKRLLLRDKQSGARISVGEFYGATAAIDTLQKTLPPEAIAEHADPIVIAGVAKQFPEYCSYAERHPYLLAMMIVVGTLIVIVIIVATSQLTS